MGCHRGDMRTAPKHCKPGEPDKLLIPTSYIGKTQPTIFFWQFGGLEAVFSEAGSGKMSSNDRKVKKNVCGDRVKITSKSVERRQNESVFEIHWDVQYTEGTCIKGQITRYQNLKMGPKKKLSDRAKLLRDWGPW